MIIIGYQGIGKSTLANSNPKYIDLESSHFFVDGERPQGWHVVYCKIARSLSEQGYHVFMSSHKVVRDYIAEAYPNVETVVVYPSLALKDEWIQKLRERYESTQLLKDFKAWKNAEDSYEQNITELSEQSGLTRISICAMNYNLDAMLSDYREGRVRSFMEARRNNLQEST